MARPRRNWPGTLAPAPAAELASARWRDIWQGQRGEYGTLKDAIASSSTSIQLSKHPDILAHPPRPPLPSLHLLGAPIRTSHLHAMSPRLHLILAATALLLSLAATAHAAPSAAATMGRRGLLGCVKSNCKKGGWPQPYSSYLELYDVNQACDAVDVSRSTRPLPPLNLSAAAAVFLPAAAAVSLHTPHTRSRPVTTCRTRAAMAAGTMRTSAPRSPAGAGRTATRPTPGSSQMSRRRTTCWCCHAALARAWRATTPPPATTSTSGERGQGEARASSNSTPAWRVRRRRRRRRRLLPSDPAGGPPAPPSPTRAGTPLGT